MGKNEVTNEQMREVLQWAYDEGKLFVNSWSVRNSVMSQQELLNLDVEYCQLSWNDTIFSVDTGKEDYPCLAVNWYGSVAFCNYLSEMKGLSPCYNLGDWSCDWEADGFRLPTEAEWEYAAKGGVNGQQTEYSGSDDLAQVGWYKDNSTNPDNPLYEGKGSHPIGMKAANELELYDLTGNVWEWCWDWFDDFYYQSSPNVDPRGPASGLYRVTRGGGWNDLSRVCRVTLRNENPPYNAHSGIGFRIARNLTDP